jgi:hypothetical protein
MANIDCFQAEGAELVDLLVVVPAMASLQENSAFVQDF